MTTPGKPVFGAGFLRYPQIASPNFNVASPAASPANSWALFSNGLAYLFGVVLSGGTITGPDYIINTSGIFIYSGTPATGNLIISITPASGTDGFGNNYGQGFSSFSGLNVAQVNAAVIGLFSGINVIVELTNAGLFLYSPSGGLGNLVASVTAASGTDSFGNAYLAGMAVYGASSTSVQMVAGSPAAVNAGSGDASESTPARLLTAIQGAGATRFIQFTLAAAHMSGEVAGAGANVILASPNAGLTTQPNAALVASDGTTAVSVQVFPNGVTVANGPLTSTAGTASAPTLITTDSWHAMTLANGWVNQGGNVTARYRLTADGGVEVIGVLNGSATTSATFFTLPAGYRPASQQSFAAGATANVATGRAPYVQCDTAGNLSIQGMNALAASGTFAFHGGISLTA